MKSANEDEAVEALSVVADVMAMDDPSEEDLARAAVAQRVIDRYVRNKATEAIAGWQEPPQQ